MKSVLITILALSLCGCEPMLRAEYERQYNAWCKLYQRNDITFEEWNLLRKNYMLPGGEVMRAAEAAENAESMAGAAMIFSAGAMGRASAGK